MAVALRAAGQLLIFFGWHTLQDFGAHILLRLWAAVPVRWLRLQRAPPGTPAAGTQWAAANIAVALLTLAYQVMRTIQGLDVSAYTVLQVPVDVGGAQLKKTYRNYAKMYHPDKVGPVHEDLFMRLHAAYQTLSDPVVRFAYDRFGSEVLEWRTCSTAHEYMRKGVEGLVVIQIQALIAHGIIYLFASRKAQRGIGMGTFVSAR